jgi:hypothetical protein
MFLDHPGCSGLQASLMAATDVVLMVTSPSEASAGAATAPPADLDSLLSPEAPIAELQRALRVWLSELQDPIASPVSIAPPPPPASSDTGLLARTGRLGAALGSTLLAAGANLSQKSAGFVQTRLHRRAPSIDILQPAAEGLHQWSARWTGWDSAVSAALGVLAGLDRILATTAPVAPEINPPIYAVDRGSSPFTRPTLSRFPTMLDRWRPHWASLARAIERQQDDRRAQMRAALSSLPLDGPSTAPTEDGHEGLAVFITRLAGVSDDQAPQLLAARGSEFPDGPRLPRPDLALVFALGNLLEDTLADLNDAHAAPGNRAAEESVPRRPAGPAP